MRYCIDAKIQNAADPRESEWTDDDSLGRSSNIFEIIYSLIMTNVGFSMKQKSGDDLLLELRGKKQIVVEITDLNTVGQKQVILRHQ